MDEYIDGKQTYFQLAQKYGCSTKTIQRLIDKSKLVSSKVFLSSATLVIDTTYFGRNFGIMVFKDSITKFILHKRYVQYETNIEYLNGINEIINSGTKIQAIVCDGRKGLFHLFGSTPMQMCQFHQRQIIRRYLTLNPKTDAGKELNTIVGKITTSSKEAFVLMFEQWQKKWHTYLQERTTNEATKKSRFTHKKLRSAMHSLKRNMQWLFVFEQYPALMIPNTTNCLEGVFTHLKNKLRNHNGLSYDRKIKFIDWFFKV